MMHRAAALRLTLRPTPLWCATRVRWFAKEPIIDPITGLALSDASGNGQKAGRWHAKGEGLVQQTQRARRAVEEEEDEDEDDELDEYDEDEFGWEDDDENDGENDYDLLEDEDDEDFDEEAYANMLREKKVRLSKYEQMEFSEQEMHQIIEQTFEQSMEWDEALYSFPIEEDLVNAPLEFDYPEDEDSFGPDPGLKAYERERQGSILEPDELDLYDSNLDNEDGPASSHDIVLLERFVGNVLDMKDKTDTIVDGADTEDLKKEEDFDDLPYDFEEEIEVDPDAVKIELQPGDRPEELVGEYEQRLEEIVFPNYVTALSAFSQKALFQGVDAQLFVEQIKEEFEKQQQHANLSLVKKKEEPLYHWTDDVFSRGIVLKSSVELLDLTQEDRDVLKWMDKKLFVKPHGKRETIRAIILDLPGKYIHFVTVMTPAMEDLDFVWDDIVSYPLSSPWVTAFKKQKWPAPFYFEELDTLFPLAKGHMEDMLTKSYPLSFSNAQKFT